MPCRVHERLHTPAITEVRSRRLLRKEIFIQVCEASAGRNDARISQKAFSAFCCIRRGGDMKFYIRISHESVWIALN